MTDGKLTRIGSLWRPKHSASRAICTGTVTVGGLRQKIVVCQNDAKRTGTSPDFLILAGGEPAEPDPYARRTSASSGGGPFGETPA